LQGAGVGCVGAATTFLTLGGGGGGEANGRFVALRQFRRIKSLVGGPAVGRGGRFSRTNFLLCARKTRRQNTCLDVDIASIWTSATKRPSLPASMNK
jgi:hypothetical protein